MKKLFIFLIAVLLINVVSAEDFFSDEFEIRLVEQDNEATTGGKSAEFRFTILNLKGTDEEFFIAKNFFSPDWGVTATPYIITVPGKGELTKSVTVNILPKKLLSLGDYTIPLPIETRDKGLDTIFNLDVTLLPGEDDIVKTTVELNDKLDPREVNRLRVSLENLGVYSLKGLILRVESDVYSQQRPLELKTGERKLESFDLPFEDTEPGNYFLNVSVIDDEGHLIGNEGKNFEILTFSDISEKLSKESNFWKSTIEISRENDGTADKNEEIVVKLERLERLFTTYSILPNDVENRDDGYYVQWNFILKPGESRSVTIVTDYTIVLWILLVIALFLLIFLYMYQSKVVIVKRVMDIDKSREAISGIKILLYVKNRTGRELKDVKIIDYLPKLVAASKKEFGTMEPSKLQVSDQGRMRLVWEFDKIGRGDERVITYVARSKLSIIGKMALPNAVVEYKSRVGRKVRKKSNKLTLFTKIEQREE